MLILRYRNIIQYFTDSQFRWVLPCFFLLVNEHAALLRYAQSHFALCVHSFGEGFDQMISKHHDRYSTLKPSPFIHLYTYI